ncbi:hypothetical protein N7456_003088 [Penicillium angulare]|uniref:Phosphonoacetate hydrolase n=1 Tax=Penicillium angulare TaxID=116970 RepID=A0A9W9FU38_9EURO|nr:hypothetical protein N7456_003088 [Penicillium angulare]
MSITTETPSTFELHGKVYKIPTQPTVVVCIDGFDPDYLQAGIANGTLPTMASFLKQGFHTTAECAMPSLTNPNNLSIITGAPTATHGVAGNYYLDEETGKEHMILDDSMVRGTTILAKLADAGVRVAAITAKDKLRKIINHGLCSGNRSICFSAQCADECTEIEHGITNVPGWLGKPLPAQYSGDLSLFVLDAGLKLLQEKRADVFYLTLSDYVQHKHASDSSEAHDFMHAIDCRLREFVKLGAKVAVTGDHGMSDKSDKEGNPNVLFLEDFLVSKWPNSGARVICPIADPFVKHHGALGGFVRVHLKEKCAVDEMIASCQNLPQVELAVNGKEACDLFGMPLDREGDIVVISKKNFVIGSRRDEHDLSQLGGHRLRSHGGLSEQEIPLLKSTAIRDDDGLQGKIWRNFDIFDLVLNH